MLLTWTKEVRDDLFVVLDVFNTRFCGVVILRVFGFYSTAKLMYQGWYVPGVVKTGRASLCTRGGKLSPPWCTYTKVYVPGVVKQ